MIKRPRLTAAVNTALRRNPIAALLGPRQCGKTTLARSLASDRSDVHFFDLEDPATLGRFEKPQALLMPLRGLIVIDEVQRRPDLFPLLRVLADRHPLPSKVLLLGSASPDLLRQSSESLAGRIEYVEMRGFDLAEAGLDCWHNLWSRGGYPRSYLAQTEEDSRQWRDQFIMTFLERDIPQLGLSLSALALRRFWTAVAHGHGQSWNSTEVATTLGVTDHTARRYLDILAGAYMVRLLPPWFENTGKRQRKAPKIYVRDSGLLHALLGIENERALRSHPKCGASWEGFALDEILSVIGSRDSYFWAVHAGPELDLFHLRDGKRYGFEFKFADAPTATRSMYAAAKELGLSHLYVVYPGEKTYQAAENITVVPLAERERFSTLSR